MSREMHGAEYLYEARARGTRVCFRLMNSIANLLEVVSYRMIRRRIYDFFYLTNF